MKIVLPKPPSVNQIYKYTCGGGFARSYISKEGTAWLKEAGVQLKAQVGKKATIVKPCEIWIDLYTSRITTQDADNVLKPLLDALQKNGIVKNDALFYKVSVEKFKVKKPEERVELEIMGF